MLREYVEWIGLDLAFQEIDAELDGLPGEYAPPRGALFVAVEGPVYLGMIALRPIDRSIAEMKRLYVRPEARGRGLARQLIARLCDEARRLNYTGDPARYAAENGRGTGDLRDLRVRRHRAVLRDADRRHPVYE